MLQHLVLLLVLRHVNVDEALRVAAMHVLGGLSGQLRLPNTNAAAACCLLLLAACCLLLLLAAAYGLLLAAGCCWLLLLAAVFCSLLLLAAGRRLFAAGCWLLAACCWLLAAGCWLLAASCWLLAAGCFLMVAGCLLLAAACWLLAACCRLLAASCLLLAAGCNPTTKSYLQNSTAWTKGSYRPAALTESDCLGRAFGALHRHQACTNTPTHNPTTFSSRCPAVPLHVLLSTLASAALAVLPWTAMVALFSP